MVSRRTIAAMLGALCMAFGLSGVAIAAEADQSKTAGGVTVYLGVIPAAIVKGPTAHEYHVVATVFDAASGARVSDAVVTAEVSGLGLSGSKMKLEPMQIGGATTYGGFLELPVFDLYTVSLTVERAGAQTAVLQFKYDHRR